MSSNEAWSDNETHQLISEYKRRPILWDTNCEVTDKRKKNATWKELANIFNTTVAEVQRKTNNLKSTFNNEEKKFKRLKAAKRKSYVPWEYYEELQFLSGHDSNTGAVTFTKPNAPSAKTDVAVHNVPMEVESVHSRLEKFMRTNDRAIHLPLETTFKFSPSKDRAAPSQLETPFRFSATKDGAVLPRVEATSRFTPTKARAAPTPSEETSRFSPTSKIAYYPLLETTSRFSPSKRIGLYPQLDMPPRISPAKERTEQPQLETPPRFSLARAREGLKQFETPPRFSPTKESPVNSQSEMTSGSSALLERPIKRRKLSPESEQATYTEKASPSSKLPTLTSPMKHTRLTFREGSCEDEYETVSESGSIISQVLSDDYDLFGAFVASEIRNLKHESNKTRLKGLIQRCILQVSEEDNVTSID